MPGYKTKNSGVKLLTQEQNLSLETDLWSSLIGFTTAPSGLPDFSWDMTPKQEKNVPNEHKMHQIVIKYLKPPYNIPNGQYTYICINIFQLGPSKIYPNWDFWFENKPSGNLASMSISRRLKKEGQGLFEEPLKTDNVVYVLC
jgi:hypothetical protein